MMYLLETHLLTVVHSRRNYYLEVYERDKPKALMDTVLTMPDYLPLPNKGYTNRQFEDVFISSNSKAFSLRDFIE